MKNSTIRNVCNAAFLVTIIQVIGCAENIREESPDTIAGNVKHVSRLNKQDLTWFAPELHLSHYRTLFYGYDTINYRLAAPEYPESKMNDSFRLLIDSNYGGDIRHYNFARLDDASTRVISHHQHDTERCQIFNSLISSCLYRDRFSLNLSRSDLENARVSGLYFLLTSGSQNYERIDLPSNYIQGFLKAIENSESSQCRREEAPALSTHQHPADQSKRSVTGGLAVRSPEPAPEAADPFFR
jgi:hypothetical protein